MKTLKNILVKALIPLTLSSAGCNVDHSEYSYAGYIDEDQVTFTEEKYLLGLAWDQNILTITKTDGRIIKYIDCSYENLKLDHVEITQNGQTTLYGNDEIGKPILEEAQKQFDDYLQKIKENKQKIKEAKIKQGLEVLK